MSDFTHINADVAQPDQLVIDPYTGEMVFIRDLKGVSYTALGTMPLFVPPGGDAKDIDTDPAPGLYVCKEARTLMLIGFDDEGRKVLMDYSMGDVAGSTRQRVQFLYPINIPLDHPKVIAMFLRVELSSTLPSTI